MENLHHFYHIWAGGKWEHILEEHTKALKKSGLLDNLTSIHFGIVGSEADRAKVKNFLASNFSRYRICAEANTGFEMLTSDAILDFVRHNDGYVFYAHTKGASNSIHININWRKSMAYHTVVQWKECIAYLDQGFCAVGSHYLPIIYDENGNDTHLLVEQIDHIKKVCGLFAGTFWWTKAKYLRKFPKALSYDRYGTEGWMKNLKPVVDSFGDEFKVYDYNSNHPHRGCFESKEFDNHMLDLS